MLRKSVLLIDDDPGIAKQLTSRLEEAGYAVTTAAGSIEAMRLIQTSAPDLIILDYVLPDVDGTKLCWILKSGQKYSAIPIIIISEKCGEEHRGVLEHVKADAFIRKPFAASDLLNKVAELLGACSTSA